MGVMDRTQEVAASTNSPIEVEITGHAGLRLTAGDRTLLVDPWLGGSAYWRSWWQYPPPVVGPEALSPAYVMLSHHHFDHFHFPSMRRIDRTARILIPRFAVDVMPGELANLGFADDILMVAESLIYCFMVCSIGRGAKKHFDFCHNHLAFLCK